MRVREIGLIAMSLPTMAMGTPAPAPSVSVLTYNIEGLPWPVRWGRDVAFTKMSSALTALRARGAQPKVIVLQEAFTPAAKAVATQSGYRYVAVGPSAYDPGVPATTTADIAFHAAASPLLGETVGKWADSGLVIASDYRILSVRRLAYPAYACAGLDCLANKGALIVTLAVPGMAQPLAVVATHLNSMVAAHVPAARSLYAYRRQVDALAGFIKASVPAGEPLILAGDFNAGFRASRRSYLVSSVSGMARAVPVTVALNDCLPDARCHKTEGSDLSFSYRRGRDWQFFWSGLTAGLRMSAMSVPFGHDGAGRMLSDHVGYTASYALVPGLRLGLK